VKFPVKYLFFFLALVLLPAALLRADVEEVHYFVRVGDKFPELTAPDDQGKKWTSTSVVGKKILVLFFYEGDFMPNCTKEAKEMQGIFTQLRGERADLVGVSGDSAESHQRFKKKNKLAFRLLSDEDGKMTYRMGVSRSGGGVQRIKEGGVEIEIRRGCTPGRWTFIVDRDGTVAYKKMDAKPVGHAKDVLAFVRRLNAQR